MEVTNGRAGLRRARLAVSGCRRVRAKHESGQVFTLTTEGWSSSQGMGMGHLVQGTWNGRETAGQVEQGMSV